jgi:hypothetical protein
MEGLDGPESINSVKTDDISVPVPTVEEFSEGWKRGYVDSTE